MGATREDALALEKLAEKVYRWAEDGRDKLEKGAFDEPASNTPNLTAWIYSINPVVSALAVIKNKHTDAEIRKKAEVLWKATVQARSDIPAQVNIRARGSMGQDLEKLGAWAKKFGKEMAVYAATLPVQIALYPAKVLIREAGGALAKAGKESDLGKLGKGMMVLAGVAIVAILFSLGKK